MTARTDGRSGVRWLLCVSVCAALLVASCGPVEELRERMRGATPHEDYVETLRAAGLLDAAAGRDWVSAGAHALRQPLTVALPVEETGYIDPVRPEAIGVRMTLLRGQRIAIDASFGSDTATRVFVDVFRVLEDSAAAPRHAAAADSGARSLEFEPARSGDYIVRLQPELLRGGRYTLRIRSGPSLSFPVDGVGERGIQSRFGAARDGGARRHHGIDIFAPRGTPVIAATSGTVSRVRETEIGGRVVWLRDERRSQSLYYAHLDTQLVRDGQRVERGDTLGTVGNTGNARTTPPHLHFGVYRRGEGPVDPFPFVHTPPQRIEPLRADTALLGGWARTTRAATLRGPDMDVQSSTAVHVRGARADEYRAVLPDGTEGWLAAAALTGASEPIRSATARAGCALLDRPAAEGALVVQLEAGAALAVLASFRDYALVQSGTAIGWTVCA